MADGQIIVANLTKQFQKARAVDDLSFSVEPGWVTRLSRPNGAGKTTTLRMLLNLVTPAAGAATIGGLRYADLPHPLRTRGRDAGGLECAQGTDRPQPPAGDPDPERRRHTVVLLISLGQRATWCPSAPATRPAHRVVAQSRNARGLANAWGAHAIRATWWTALADGSWQPPQP